MKGFYITFESVGNAVLKECEIPVPKDDEVLIECDFSAISTGTEGSNFLQKPNTVTSENGFPFMPGYSASGRVVETGKNVDNLKEGDRVVVSRISHRSHIVTKASSVLKIEDDRVDSIDAAFTQISSFPLLGVRKLRIEIGEAVMVAGMGILGAFAVQFAALSGGIPVVVSDPDPLRRKLALELGASAVFSPYEENFVEKVKDACGGEGPKSVVEVTGIAAALQQALEYIAFEGRIALLGCTRISDLPIDFYKYVHRRGISLIGAHGATRAHFESSPGRWTEQDNHRTFLKLVAAGKLQVRPLISEIVSPQEAGEVYSRIVKTETTPPGIVFDWHK